MFAALLVMATLVATTPFVAIFDGSLVRGIVAGAAAIAMAASAWSMPAGEGRHMGKLVAPLVIGLAIPALWMAIQALPLPFGGPAHPIWASAADAVGESLMGRISLDPASTLNALARYLTMVGVVTAVAALAIDRQRAEVLLFCLTGAAALAGIILIARGIAHFSLGGEANDQEIAQALIGVCALGLPVSVAAAGHVFERYERQRLRSETPANRFGLAFIGCVAALAICIAELVSAASPQVLSLAILGFLIIAGVVLVRRLRISAWLTVVATIVAIIAAAALVVTRPAPNDNLTLRYSDASPALVEMLQMMMTDAGWAGTGGGTFSALLPIYQQADQRGLEVVAPTAAAEIVVELGQPALWIMVAMAIAAVAYLLRAALTRGRDSFYAAAAASSVVVVVLEGFTDPSGLHTAVGLFVAAVFGIGIAQSVSRSVQ